MLKLNILLHIFYLFFFLNILISSKHLKYPIDKEQYYLNDDINCPENCKDGKCDNSTKKCDSCIEGYHGNECNEKCSTNCISCTQDEGNCESCKDGLNPIGYYCCVQNCIECNDDGCIKCNDNKYGKKCQDCPEYCEEKDGQRKCDQDIGNCYSCVNGKFGETCEFDCNEGCDLNVKNCDMNDGTCTCKDGFYGTKCENECDKNCEDCDKIDGTCNQCKAGYYPKNKDCIKCPENCEGECPEGICEACKDGFYGDICDMSCSIFCKGNKCNKNDGMCECINYFSKESFCSKCINHYDLDTNCTQCVKNYNIDKECNECLNKYDIDKECKECLPNYDINKDCSECINHYNIDDDCKSCLPNYDINKDCSECINHYNIDDDCKTCLPNYDINKTCAECINHYNIDDDCKTCLPNYNIDKDCSECINHYNIDDDCKTCLPNYDIDKKCNECINKYDIDTECQSCLPNYDIDKTCSECINHYDIKTECKYCLPNYDIDKKCNECINFFDISSQCTKCLEHFDINSNCTQCLNSYNKETNCTSCLNNYDIQKDCDECLPNYDIKSDCIDCIENYDKSAGCSKCINNYDLSSNCTICLNHYDINKNCAECLNKYNIDDDCKSCLPNYDINSNCTLCINKYDIDDECKSCLPNYDISDSCKSCIGNYDLSQNCEKCINHYDLSAECKQCEIHFTFSSNCTQCETNFNITTNCSTCINEFDLSTDCTNCHIGFYGNLCNETCYEGCNTSVSNCRQEDGYCEICKFPYYGEKCENKASIPGCITYNKTTGECLKCEDTFYLSNNVCEKCSSNCTDSLCEDNTGKCISCSNYFAFGDFCDEMCSEFCNTNETEIICMRDTGACIYGCNITGNFSDAQCTQCKAGFYPQSKGCTTRCSSNCLNIETCNQANGFCINCIDGYKGDKCDEKCDILCADYCDQKSGICNSCIDGYYKDITDQMCKECPINCTVCSSPEKCSSCKEGKTGYKCEEDCSPNCDGNQCEIDGSCKCKKEYYGQKCSLNCSGCANSGCDDLSGECKDHYCNGKYYDPRMCDKKCSENCGGEGKCDLFTGECISCNENMWGMNCTKICSLDCENDGRVDCCYIKDKDNENAKGIQLDLKNNNYLKDEQNEFWLIKINLGGFDLTILADFESNSPLAIFDKSTKIIKIDTEIYNISVDLKYDSAISKNYKEIDPNYQVGYDYEGFILNKEKIAKDLLAIGKIEFSDFKFLICKEFKLEKDFDKAGEINGIVGLGLRNDFTENLFWYNNLENKLPKNILVKYISEKENKKFIYIGDYNNEIRQSFSKLSTLEIINKDEIKINKVINYETTFTGIAYSLRKAYEYKFDKRVKLNNRIETNIVFNSLYKQFFEKIYFGDLFENGCYFRVLQGGQGEYYCDLGKKQAIKNLPKLGLILGNYIYYLSNNFLYKESGQFITFVIKLHGQSQEKIELGKSFFNEFNVVYNNGNETLNFFGDIKKLSVTLKDPSTFLNIDSDVFTPGGWVTLIAFITALIIIFCYLIKYCGQKGVSDEDDMENSDGAFLIDDVME